MLGNVISVAAPQYGATGMGLVDDGPAINAALRDAATTRSAVFMPSGVYRVESTIEIPAFVTLFSESPTSDVSWHACTIMGTVDLDPIVRIDGGPGSAAASLRNVGITRADGPIQGRGLLINHTDHTVVEDVYLWRHAIGCEIGGQLGIKLTRVITSRITETHVLLSGGPEITMVDCRFGRNGVSETHCRAFLTISGNVDTLTMLRGQFNGNADYGVLWIQYASPNGIFYFTNCHAEGWGTFLVGGHGLQNKIARVIITGCSITCSAQQQFIGGTLKANLDELILNGNLIGSSLVLDQQEVFAITGNRIIGSVTINQGAGTFMANVLYSSALLEGVMYGVVFAGNCFDGPGTRLTDLATGQKSVYGNATRTP